jgi:kinetochore protein Mis12/MTW1
MEEFLQKWADEKLAKTPSILGNDAIMHEVEQGLVAFQTLWEHHTDIVFDFFEAWCVRNIFMIPSDVPIVYFPIKRDWPSRLRWKKNKNLWMKLNS